MTREEKQKAIDILKKSAPIMAVTQEEFNDYIQTLNKVMDWLEQQPCENAISRQAVLDAIGNVSDYDDGMVWEALSHAQRDVALLPLVTPQQKIGHCKDCKWWKDSDGVYRRGVRAESQCPINRREVYEGNGYCFWYEPQESEE